MNMLNEKRNTRESETLFHKKYQFRGENQIL